MKKNEQVIKQLIDKSLEYLKENQKEFAEILETIDARNGFLETDRYYDMARINDFYYGQDMTEFLTWIYSGYDQQFTHSESKNGFNPTRMYFKQDEYGNVISTDEKNYSKYLKPETIQMLCKYKGSFFIPEELECLLTCINIQESLHSPIL